MENWKPVKDFEGKVYEVSDLGRVRRIKAAQGATVGALVKAHPQQGGYLLVHLRDTGRDVQKALHIIVAEAFLPNPLNLPEVNHLGCKRDCRASMLEWRSDAGNKLCEILKKPLRGIRFREDFKKWTATLRGKSLGSYATKKEAQSVRRKAVESLPHIL